MAYKIMKHINKLEKNSAKLQVISEEQWIEHNRNLWYDPNINEQENSHKEICTKDTVDPISWEEFNESLSHKIDKHLE
jgi:hypothetical protein